MRCCVEFGDLAHQVDNVGRGADRGDDSLLSLMSSLWAACGTGEERR